jgi:predicted dehydrogenase
MLGAGVIGLGVGRTHCLGYAESEHVELRAVCDLVDERREWAQERFDVDAYREADELLIRGDIQVVSVCTPDYTHREMVTKALQANKHVLLEKPMAITLPDCESIARQVERAGVTFTVDYEFRFNPVVQELKRLVDSGELGRVAAISLYFWRGPFQYSKPGRWIQQLPCSGGMLVQETCHWFDLLRWFGGEVENVSCQSTDRILPETQFEDVAYANVRFRSGAAGHVTHSLAGFAPVLLLWVFGTRTSAWAYVRPWIHDQNPALFLGMGNPGEYGRVAVAQGYPHTDEEKRRLLDTVRVTTYGSQALEQENTKDLVLTFAECVATGSTPLVTVEDGFRSVELSLAARASSLKDGAPVRLPLSQEMAELASEGFITTDTLIQEREAVKSHLLAR